MSTNELINQLGKPAGHSPWDAKRISGLLVAGGIILLLAYLFTTFILPMLLTMVWGTLELIVGCVILAFVCSVVFNPKFWRALRYLSEGLSQMFLGAVIDMNPWVILRLKIEDAEADRKDLKKHAERLRGERNNLKTQLDENQVTMNESGEAVNLAKAKLQQVRAKYGEDSPEYLQASGNLEIVGGDFENAKSFITDVKGLFNDIDKLVTLTDKAYFKTGILLEVSKKKLAKEELKYKAVTTATATMKSALRAFVGNPTLNADAEIAIKKLREDISTKMGVIQDSIKNVSQFMSINDLKDAAKLSLATKSAENLDKSFDYATSITESSMSLPSSQTSVGDSNKYMSVLLDKKAK